MKIGPLCCHELVFRTMMHCSLRDKTEVGMKKKWKQMVKDTLRYQKRTCISSKSTLKDVFFLDFEKISFMMIWDAKHEFYLSLKMRNHNSNSIFAQHTGAKSHFLSIKSLEFFISNDVIFVKKIRFSKRDFYENEILKMPFL